MAVPRLRNFIDGGFSEPGGAAWLPVENPSTGEIIAEAPLSRVEEVETAVAAAMRAFPA